MNHRCDRCDTQQAFVHLIGWSTQRTVYWLCQYCIDGIVVDWLAQHSAEIEHVRRQAKNTDNE